MTGPDGSPRPPARPRPSAEPSHASEPSGTGILGWTIVIFAAVLACAGQVLWLYGGTQRVIGIALVVVAGAILLAHFLRLALRGLPKRRKDRRPGH
ncbi:MAG: hypothetical protein H0W83_08080 [Planctomycetes bacterium]|nr:hypothetical protein [Planctomycetota bacterium]